MNRMIPKKSETAKGGRENLNGLPRHIGRVKLPKGDTLADLSFADIARLCIVLKIPGAGHEVGKLKNAELLVSTLESIGQQAAEQAIEAHLSANLGSVR